MLTEVIEHENRIIVHVGNDVDVEAYSNLATYVLPIDAATRLRDQLTTALQYAAHRDSPRR